VLLATLILHSFVFGFCFGILAETIDEINTWVYMLIPDLDFKYRVGFHDIQAILRFPKEIQNPVVYNLTGPSG
jgi:hypothetical protein